MIASFEFCTAGTDQDFAWALSNSKLLRVSLKSLSFFVSGLQTFQDCPSDELETHDDGRQTGCFTDFEVTHGAFSDRASRRQSSARPSA